MEWRRTYLELFREADAAKERAKAAFLASLVPPNPAVVPADKVIPLVDVMMTAQWEALLTHIGPVSSDETIAIGTRTTPEGVKQLDLRARAWPDPGVPPPVPPPVLGTLFYLVNGENETEGYSDPQSLRTALQPGYDYTTTETSVGAPSALAYATTDMGVPHLSALPAGDWLLRVHYCADDGDSGPPAGPATIQLALRRKSAGGTVLDTLASGITTPATTNPEWSFVDLTVTIGARDWSLTDRLSLDAWAYTTSATPVQVYLGMAGLHASFVRAPFVAVAAGGSNWHPDLGGRDLASQHPDSAVTTTPMAEATWSTVIITMPVATNGAKLAAGRFRYAEGGMFNGVDPTGFVAGQEICLYVDIRDGEVHTLGHNKTPPGGFPSSARFLLKGAPPNGKIIKTSVFISFRLDLWSDPPGWREI